MQDLKLITFDLDDTLWPIGHVIDAAERALHAWLSEHAPATAARYTPETLRALREEAQDIHPELGSDISALRRASIRLALLRSGEPATELDALADAAFAEFWHARNDVVFYPDVMPALTHLSSRFRLAAISNGNADLRLTGLDAHLEFVVAAREFGRAKPDRAIFRAACDRAGVKPGDVLHVGDDLICDVRGAIDSGLNAAWLNRDNATARAPGKALVIRQLGELVDHLCADNVLPDISLSPAS